VEFDKALILKELRIKAKLQLTALGRQFRFPAHLLRGRFESAQTTNLFHNSFGIELVLQPFKGSIDWLTFSHNNFGHKNPLLTSLLRTRGK
jgi:muramoyltetrapeptide carboxypeptidase LdcA involved in peptidoglycan recycling